MVFNLFYRVLAYVRHRFKSLISSRGYGIHSPFAFELVTAIINNKNGVYYCFDSIEQLRYKCLQDTSSIPLMNGKRDSIARLCRRSSSPDKDAQMIFKLGLRMQSKNIIELGSFLGFGTAYLASISSQAQVISIDHNPSTLAYAKKTIEALHYTNVSFKNKRITEALPQALEQLKHVDLLFFDAHHTYQATLDYFSCALPYVTAKTVFIFHDIHWSKDMYKAWKTIIKNADISLSIECQNIGCVFFDPELQKRHYYA